MIHRELKKAITYWLLDHEYEFQRVNTCIKHFKEYIYNTEGNYLIGGEDVKNFIIDTDKTIYGKIID